MLAEILLEEAVQSDDPAFVGHIGGDDFIVIHRVAKIENYSNRVLKSFQELSANQPGADYLSVALAGLIIDPNHEQMNWSAQLVAQKCAIVKKEAKELGGNVIVLR